MPGMLRPPVACQSIVDHVIPMPCMLRPPVACQFVVDNVILVERATLSGTDGRVVQFAAARLRCFSTMFAGNDMGATTTLKLERENGVQVA